MLQLFKFYDLYFMCCAVSLEISTYLFVVDEDILPLADRILIMKLNLLIMLIIFQDKKKYTFYVILVQRVVDLRAEMESIDLIYISKIST